MSTLVMKYNEAKPVQAVRRARRAYVGLHVMAFEAAQLRLKDIRAKRLALLDDLAAKGQTMEDHAAGMVSDVKTKMSETYEDGTEAVTGAVTETVAKFMPKRKSVTAELEAEIETLTAKLAKMEKTAKAAKKKVSKKTVAKKTVTEKTAVKAAPAAAAKTAVEAKVEAADKYAPHFEAVMKYDAKADAAIVRKIVNHLGIALQSRDGQFVACSDSTERDTVAQSWLVKKLGVEGTAEVLDDKVGAICKVMQADRMKSRVTFYYLLAKQEGKLAAL